MQEKLTAKDRKGAAKCPGPEPCLYCDAHLATRHEHDHAPMPFRYGGSALFCVCLNCHDLKDRQRLLHLPEEFKNVGLEQLTEAFGNLGKEGRIMAAIMLTVSLDAEWDYLRSIGVGDGDEGAANSRGRDDG